MISKKDKDKIITLLAFIAVVAFIVICVRYTSKIPLGAIAVAFAVLSFVLMGLIGYSYFKLYNGGGSAAAGIPIVQGFFIFPKAVAIMEIVAAIVCLVLVVGMLIPSSFLLGVMSEHMALNYHTFVGSYLLLALVLFLEILCIGFDCIFHDVQTILRECTNTKSPFIMAIHYVLLLVPVVNAVSLAQLYVLISNVRGFGWAPGSVEESKTNNLKEVVTK